MRQIDDSFSGLIDGCEMIGLFDIRAECMRGGSKRVRKHTSALQRGPENSPRDSRKTRDNLAWV